MKKYTLIVLLIGIGLSSTASATLVHQQWNTGVTGSRQAIIDFLVDLVDPVPAPDVDEIINETLFRGSADNYVAKFYGWVTVPESGDYQFHYACDDFGMLYVSQDEEMANAAEVAWVDGWAGNAEWDKYPTQHSEVMKLTKGQVMAVMAFYQEAGGGDNMDIGWTGPGLSSDITNPTYLTDYITHIAIVPTKAKHPLPEVEATDVPRDAALAWDPGKFAAKHNIYLGTSLDAVNGATVANPSGVLVQAGHTATSFDPGILTFGQTYYWRVDEVNAPPTNTVYPGKIWSFTVEPMAIPVTNITATASGANLDMGPEKTIDGSGLNEMDQHSTEPLDMWLAAGANPWIQYEFDKPHKLHELLVWNSNQVVEAFLGFGVKEMTIETSLDGENWTALGGVATLTKAAGLPDHAVGNVIDMGGVMAQAVKLTVVSAHGFTGQNGLSEVRFMAIPVFAREPQPADGTTADNINVQLAWRSGREAVSHEVYLGPDAENLALIDTTNEATTLAHGLLYDTAYAWSVTEVNDAADPAAHIGDVWTFKTPQFGVVDDFESYSGDEGEEVFTAWFDGFGGDTSLGGSTTGLADGPFVETTMVRGDNQSMPLFYDNDGGFVDIDGKSSSPNFSEVVREFTPAQDWTAGAPATLVLWVHGQQSNPAANQLYVKINNTKVVHDGDISVPIWRPWHIDLAGMNVSSVRSLSIGVDGSGSGMLYVDDIALYGTGPAIAGAPAGGDPSLVAHWKLDETEGLDVADSSGYGNNGTLVGMDGTEWTTGILDGALELAGGSSGTPKYINFGNPTSLQLYDSATMSVWVKMNEGNADVYMGIGGKLISGFYQGFSLVRHDTNVFRLWCDDGNGVLAGHDASSDDSYTDTEWHHVVGVIDNGTSILYVDGVRQAKEGQVDLTDSQGIAYIGKQYGDDSSHRYWNGLIDDARIYYRALSAQEISGL